MSLYAIGDLHLCLGAYKPMDVFGGRWEGYMEKLREGLSVIAPGDTTVLLGDLSWALGIEQAEKDFAFLHEIPGRKIILKGNHDYWWTSMKKLGELCADEGFTTLRFLYNNAFEVETFIVAGSRGWYIDESNRRMPENADYQKIVAREAIRLEISLNEAVKLREKRLSETGEKREILVFLHFPPDFREYVCEEITAVLKKFGIKRCFFGHIHGVYDIPLRTYSDGIEYTITSADYLDFKPLKIEPFTRGFDS